jgi:hypothetical protein
VNLVKVILLIQGGAIVLIGVAYVLHLYWHYRKGDR